MPPKRAIKSDGNKNALGLSEKEMRMLAFSWICLDGANPKIDHAKLAPLCDYTPGSCVKMWGNLRSKLNKLAASEREDPEVIKDKAKDHFTDKEMRMMAFAWVCMIEKETPKIDHTKLSTLCDYTPGSCVKMWQNLKSKLKKTLASTSTSTDESNDNKTPTPTTSAPRKAIKPSTGTGSGTKRKRNTKNDDDDDASLTNSNKVKKNLKKSIKTESKTQNKMNKIKMEPSSDDDEIW